MEDVGRELTGTARATLATSNEQLRASSVRDIDMDASLLKVMAL